MGFCNDEPNINNKGLLGDEMDRMLLGCENEDDSDLFGESASNRKMNMLSMFSDKSEPYVKTSPASNQLKQNGKLVN